MSLNMLRVAGKLLDFLFVMSYDAGDKRSPPGDPTGYDPKARTSQQGGSLKRPLQSKCILALSGMTPARLPTSISQLHFCCCTATPNL